MGRSRLRETWPFWGSLKRDMGFRRASQSWRYIQVFEQTKKGEPLRGHAAIRSWSKRRGEGIWAKVESALVQLHWGWGSPKRHRFHWLTKLIPRANRLIKKYSRKWVRLLQLFGRVTLSLPGGSNGVEGHSYVFCCLNFECCLLLENSSLHCAISHNSLLFKFYAQSLI